MTPQPKTEIVVKGLPVEVKRALAKASKKQKTSMNDVAVTALCDEFGVEWKPVGRPLLRRDANGVLGKAKITDSLNMSLTVPVELRTLLNVLAAQGNATQSGLVISTLAKHFGLPPRSPVRRRRTTRV